jgi:hypothetical protein
MMGPYNPPGGAMFLWRCNNPDVIERYAQNDPYVQAGLVPSYSIIEWTVVLKA